MTEIPDHLFFRPEPLLTIGIPTWNRCSYLKKNIERIIQLIEKYNIKNIQLLVSDNASIDETESLCRNLSQDYPFFSYIRHKNNKGANANFESVIAAAQGQYVWLLGDDDLITDNLKLILEDILFYSPDIIIGPSLLDMQQKINLKNIHTHVVIDYKILKQTHIIALAGKISGLIFKKNAILPIIKKSHQILNKNKFAWPHLVWLILYLNEKNNKLLLLPYGTHTILEEHWHNLLFTGMQLLQVHVEDYFEMVLALSDHLRKDFYFQLIYPKHTYRIFILFRCLFYSTYSDNYWAVLRYACFLFKKTPGIRNKLHHVFFLIFPLLIPIKVRKFMITSLAVISLKQGKCNKLVKRLQYIHQKDYTLELAKRFFTKSQL